ncbi:MAG: polysaccharide biosynthesis C-terminal domain-containing protein [Candidatus Sulfotelmatobacter sp.]
MNPAEPGNPAPEFASAVVTPSQRPLSMQIVRGVVFSLVRKLLSGPIFLLVVPFILHRVGAAGYGTWSIIGAIIGLSWFLDLGLSDSVTKHIAEHRGSGDLSQLRRFANASSAVYLVLTTVALFLLWLFSRAIIAGLFRGPDAPSLPAILSLWPLLLAIVGIDLLTKPFMSAINGCQRFDLSNLLLFSANASNVLLTVIFLSFGGNLRGLMWATLLSTLLTLLLSIGVARHLLPSVIPNPLACDFATVRGLCAFSLGLYAGSIMTTIQGQAEKIYLARFLGVVPVGWYNMASEAASKVRRMPDLLLGPVMAATSELDATRSWRKISELHFRAHKYLAVTTIPLVVFAIVSARALVVLWLGPKMSIIAFPFALLLIGNLFPQVGAPTYFVLVGRGILRPSVYAAVIASVLNVVLSLVFIWRWGFAGAVWGSVIPMIVSNVCFFIMARPYFEGTLYEVLQRAYLKPILCASAAAAVMSIANVQARHLWLEILSGGAIFAIVYILGLVVTRFFDAFDFSKAESHIPFARLVRRLVPASSSI